MVLSRRRSHRASGQVSRLAFCLLACVPVVAAAQGRGPSSGAPKWFASLSSGLVLGDYIADDASNSTWDFDAGFGLRGTVEREVATRVSVGLAFAYARLPLTYSSLGTSSLCAQCAANATVSSYGGTVRVGGGPGFHQVIELFLGALRYGNFEQQVPRATLAPKTSTDFAFGAGYGFGYSLANDWQVELIQDATNSLHERSTLLQGGSRVARHFTTRLGLRIGF